MNASSSNRKTPYRRSTAQKACWGSAGEKGVASRWPARRRGLEIRYINLENRVQRRLEMEERLREAGLASCAQRFRARTGDEAPEALVTREWDSRLNSQYDKTTMPHPRVPMTRGERGCAMSHACLWVACASRPDDSWPLVVLEDDVEFTSNVAIHLARVIAKVEDTFGDPKSRNIIVYLGADVASWGNDALNTPQRKARLRAEASAFFDATKPVKITSDSSFPAASSVAHKTVKLLAANYVWQTSSYVIWPAAARQLVANFPIAEPVDNFISRMLLAANVHALVCLPYLARQVAAYCNGDIVHSRPAVACPEGDPKSTPIAPIW